MSSDNSYNGNAVNAGSPKNVDIALRAQQIIQGLIDEGMDLSFTSDFVKVLQNKGWNEHADDSVILNILAHHSSAYECDPALTRKLFERAAETAFEEGCYGLALLIYEKLGDIERLKSAIDNSSQYDEILYGAIMASFNIGYKDGQRKCARRIIKGGLDKSFLRYAISGTLTEKVSSGFKEIEKHFRIGVPSFPLHDTLNAAYVLRSKYDVALGNAKGGLYSAFIFEQMGYKTILCQTQKETDRFMWHTGTPEIVEGKRVLVLDKDVVSGASLVRVLREVNVYSPAEVSVFLNHSPIMDCSGTKEKINLIGSKTKNIPDSYKNIFYPENLSYDKFWSAITRLEQRMGCRK